MTFIITFTAHLMGQQFNIKISEGSNTDFSMTIVSKSTLAFTDNMSVHSGKVPECSSRKSI